MKNKLKNFLVAIFCALVWTCCVFLDKSNAIVIEGFDPSGNFKAVGVDANGNFKTILSTAQTAAVVIQGTTTFKPSFGQVAVGPNSATLILSTDTARVLTIICNIDTPNVLIGEATVSTETRASKGGNGFLLPPNACLTADGPTQSSGSSFYGNSTATANMSYYYSK